MFDMLRGELAISYRNWFSIFTFADFRAKRFCFICELDNFTLTSKAQLGKKIFPKIYRFPLREIFTSPCTLQSVSRASEWFHAVFRKHSKSYLLAFSHRLEWANFLFSLAPLFFQGVLSAINKLPKLSENPISSTPTLSSESFYFNEK